MRSPSASISSNWPRQTAQASAGAAYAAAAAAYHAAFVELHAYDLAVGNRNIGGVTLGAQPTFNIRPQVLPHPRFYPAVTANILNGPLKGDDVAARVAQLVASYSPG